MNPDDIDFLKVWVLLSPLMVCGVALLVVWLTGWQDRREERRRHTVDKARRASRKIFRRSLENNP